MQSTGGAHGYGTLVAPDRRFIRPHLARLRLVLQPVVLSALRFRGRQSDPVGFHQLVSDDGHPAQTRAQHSVDPESRLMRSLAAALLAVGMTAAANAQPLTLSNAVEEALAHNPR